MLKRTERLTIKRVMTLLQLRYGTQVSEVTKKIKIIIMLIEYVKKLDSNKTRFLRREVCLKS